MGSSKGEAVDAPASSTAAATALARLRAGETLGASELAEWLTIDADRFATGTLGLRWDRISLSEVAGHLDIDERHRQPYGIVHGGVWCAVVESLASVAAALQVADSGRVVVGVSNSTDFLRSHREGRVEAVATPVHVGRSQQVWQVWLTRSEDGKAIARGQVRLANIAPATVGAHPEGTAG